jgi:hypothetical protein
MNQFVTQIAGVRSRRSARALALQSLAPLTVLGAAVWAILQPWRIALLHPAGKGF